jgi:hypothetical protein
MANTVTTSPAAVRGKIIEAEIKVSVDPARQLPLACALYAIEAADGVWLCAYYGANRSNFDYLPQKGAEVDEKALGIAFQVREFVAKDDYRPERWQQFVQSRLRSLSAH